MVKEYRDYKVRRRLKLQDSQTINLKTKVLKKYQNYNKKRHLITQRSIQTNTKSKGYLLCKVGIPENKLQKET